MRIEATAEEIRALLQLADLDAQAQSLAPETLRARRDASFRRVAKPLRERYQTLLDIGRHPVVVPIDHGSCSGCHVRLPAMIEYQARRTPAVHSCPRCRRMLYAPELVGEQDPGAAAPRKKARRGVPAGVAERP